MKAEAYFADPVQIKLAKAAAKGDKAAMDKAITAGAAVNGVGAEGMTPLFWALSKQNLEGFNHLLDKDADPNTLSHWMAEGKERSAGALELAAGVENPGYLRALLDHGGDPNTLVTKGGKPLLYQAMINRRLDNVKLLLKYGADINQQENSLETPLMRATKANLYEIALFLLRAGADPTIKNDVDYGPADNVIKYGNRGINRATNDMEAFYEYVDELAKRGLLNKEDVPIFE